jgi:hypothetical protein
MVVVERTRGHRHQKAAYLLDHVMVVLAVFCKTVGHRLVTVLVKC